MPTYREQISVIVDEGIRQGRIAVSMRDDYINRLTADDKAAEFFATSLIHNGDYTKKTQALADERRKLEAERQASQDSVATERLRLEAWQNQVLAEVNRLRGLEAQFPEMTAKIAAYEQAIESYGLKDSVKVPTFSRPPATPAQPPHNPTQTRPPNGAPPAPGSDGYLTREEGLGYLREVMQMNSKALQLMGRHQQLFGAPLVDDIVGEALAQGVGPERLEEYWATKYNTPAREAELAAQRANQEREALKAELRSEILAEVTSDPTRHIAPGMFTTDARPSPIAQYMRPGLQAPGGASAAVDPSKPALPENISPVKSMSNTISEAALMFRQNYTPDGIPRTGGGPAQAP